MSMMSETIVLLWLVPVALNIILPLVVLGCWIGVQFLRLLQRKVAVEPREEKEDPQYDRLLSAAKN